MRLRFIAFLTLCLAATAGLVGSGAGAEARQTSLEEEFARAAEEYGVPEELLKAMGYVNTRWEMPPPDASEYEEGGPTAGAPDARGNYGIMSLYENPSTDTLGRAADLTGIPEQELKTDRAANIRGGAALLADIQGQEKPADVNGWYDAVAEGWDGSLYANQVYETLKSGASAEVGGETVTLEPQPGAEVPATVSAQSSGEYPRSTWYGAHSGNYTNASRGAAQIDKIIVHVTQGSFSGAINWFRDSRANASAHYTVRSSDGFVGQSVREEDIAWHAGWWDYNKRSVGIEHEGYVSNSSWFTDAMYRSSARLTAYLARKYRIPIDRNHIIAHSEVPGCSGSGGGVGCHTDPGRYWDWDRYMRYVKSYAGSPRKSAAYRQVVDNTSRRFRVSGSWDTNRWNARKYGSNYRATRPNTRGVARFAFRIPSRGRYDVYAWWPSSSGYNNRVKYRVRTAGGWKQKVVSQRTNGGRWVRLGRYTLRSDKPAYVYISGRSGGSGWIIADAVKVVKR